MLSCTRSTALIVALGLALTALPASAQTTTWNLITAEEAARNNAAPQVPAPPDLPAPPSIELVRPDISRPIQNPATIEVNFIPGPAACSSMPRRRPLALSPMASNCRLAIIA